MRAERSPVLVGRQRQVAAIQDGLSAVAQRRGGCLVLLGEAGAGKTRILREARMLAEQRGMVVLAAGPAKVVAPPAYGLISAALRGWTRANGMPQQELAPFAAGLWHILPEWPAPAATVLSPDQLRLLVLEGAFQLLVHAAGRHGAVLLLDDLQDADPETIEFLHHAATSVPNEPVLVVAAARTPEGESVRREAEALRSRGLATVLPVDPLTESGVTLLLGSMLHEAPPPALVNHIYTNSDGIALFVEELLDAQLRSGALRYEAGGLHWHVTADSHPPQTTAAIAAEKLDRLNAEARRVLVAAAVLGRIDRDLLAAVTELDQTAVVDALRAGVEVGLLDSSAQEIGFRHALIRDALVMNLLPPEHTALHQRMAQALERAHGDEPSWLAERAYHLRAIGADDHAATLLTRAGRWSLNQQAPASAEATLRQAVHLARSESTRREATDALAEAIGQLGRWEEALRLGRELLPGGPGEAARLLRMAGNAVRVWRLDEAEELIRKAADAGHEPSAVCALQALAMLYRGDLTAAASAAQRALATDPEPVVACQALDVLGRSLDALGRREEARRQFRRWIDLARVSGLVSQQVQARMELGTQQFLSGGPADELERARDLATRQGLFVPLVLADLSLTWWLGRRARSADAAARSAEAVELCRRFSLDLLPHALISHGWATNLADLDSGEPLVSQALALAPDDVDLCILAGWIRGEAALRAGRPQDAVTPLSDAAAAMRAAPSAVPPPAPFLLPVAYLLAERRDDAAAALAAARMSPALARQYVNRFWLSCADALLAGSADQFDQAVAPYVDSATFDVALARAAAAQILQGDRAIAWLRDALTVFTANGMETDAAVTRRLLRSFGGPVPRRRSGPADDALRAFGVTPREAEVLTLVAQGLTNPQIAQRLYLSDRTVQTHVSSLLAKMRAPNRAGLIAVAYTLGKHP